MFTAETRREIAAIANDLELEPEALLAIAEVESGGKGFAIVGGKPEPLIRFEGHYFDRRLSAANRMGAGGWPRLAGRRRGRQSGDASRTLVAARQSLRD
jgi:hypothetical protein